MQIFLTFTLLNSPPPLRVTVGILCCHLGFKKPESLPAGEKV